MKKFLADKRTLLMLGIVCLLALILLVASLANLSFKPAVPFAAQDESEAIGTPLKLPPASFIVMIVIFAAMLVAIFLMLPKEQRKRYLTGLLQFVLLAALIVFVMSLSSTDEKFPQPTQEFGTPAAPIDADPTEQVLPDVTPTPFVPPELSPWASFLVALTVLVPVGVGLWWWLARRRAEELPYDELAEIAKSTLDDLESGKDWGEAVVNCYYRMTKAIESQRGLRRRAHYTPSEFVVVLERAHLPGDALRRLTVLFERVRYGGKLSTQEDIDDAVACLTEIVDACQGAR